MQFFSELDQFVHQNPAYAPPVPDPRFEDLLERSLERKELHKLIQLPAFARPLPRLYLQTDPSQTQLKPPFRSLPTLKRLLIEKAIAHLYATLAPPKQGCVVLLTWVIADGWGDYIAQKEAARAIFKHSPHLKLSLITLIHRDKQPPPFPEKFDETVIRFTGNLNSPLLFDPFPIKTQRLLNQADLVIELPTTFCEIHKYVSPKKMLRIGEHCTLDTALYHPGTGNYSMGLHCLEVGVFTKQPPRQTPAPLPLLNEKGYSDTHDFNCGYNKTFRGTYLYLLTLCSLLKQSDKTCDLVLFNMPLIALILSQKFCPSSSGMDFLKRCHIRAIHLHHQNNKSILPIAPEGKILRLFILDTISQNEMQTLISLSQHLISSTGDQSVLEAIATGTPFFFDHPRLKRNFLRDLSLIAEERISSTLATYFRLLLVNPLLEQGEIENGWISEDDLCIAKDRLSIDLDTEEKLAEALAYLLSQSGLQKDFKQLARIIQEEYPFEPFLLGQITRRLFHRQNPGLEQEEEREILRYIEGKQTAKTTLDRLLYPISKTKMPTGSASDY